MSLTIAALLGALMSGGCCGPSRPMFSSLPNDQKEPIQTYTFAQPYAVVYQACYDALSNGGFEVTVSDRSAGQIGTTYMQISDTPMSIGTTEDVLLRPIRAKVNAKVTTIDSTSTKVKLNILLQYMPQAWQELPRNVDQMRTVYEKYFGLIQKELQ
jgi:hypothetical protein